MGIYSVQDYDGCGPVGRPSMKSYDEIRDHLQVQLDEATERHAREESEETRTAVESARDRYERFVFHGMIPDDLED